MSDLGSDHVELTDDEWRELLAPFFGAYKRTPEQVQEAKDRLRTDLQMQPGIAPPQFRPQIQAPGKIKKSG